MNRHVLAKVNYNPGYSGDVFYGPFTDMEYVAFKEWLGEVVNTAWTYTIDSVYVNTKVTSLFLEIKDNVNA